MNRLIILLTLVLSLPVAARRQVVGPTKLKKTAPVEALYDTIVPAKGEIVCAGYDKPNRATRETFFITNNTADTLQGINLTFEYSDLKGRQLHSASHTIKTALVPGETRNVSISSWDRNNSFHYYLSPAPKRRPSTPYRVSSRINFLLIKK